VDNSFAVLKEAVAAMKPAPAPTVTDSAAAVEVATSELRVRVEKDKLRVVVMDGSGRVLSEDDPNRPTAFSTMTLAATAKAIPKSFVEPEKAGNTKATAFQVWKLMPEDENYFGLGDKTGPLNHRNEAFTMWNTDAFGWQESTDPLYKAIPFYLALRNGT